ncbi:392_t:CDS:2 [Gigaspora margarita]|uniref:Polynucleotide phosphorylase 1 n=1 Tax=Gigaspora margarita TaxID=4874 RepID=A0ABM8VWZ8_GIGMA|nr:392_t:CDS:2 [Gigaspora margarita]
MNILAEITQPYFRTDLPQLTVGDKIEVITKNFDPREKNEKPKYRLTHFKGTVIAQKNPKRISYTLSVLKESSKIASTSVFFYHSPLIASIKKLGRINRPVRRAKLYFLERETARKKDNESDKNKFEFNFRGREVVFEIDQLARKSDKSILGRYGNTTVLTVLIVKELAKKINSFFPLTITVEEKFYAVGRIPAQFNKREGKPSYDAITVARLIDRSLRSFFPSSGNQEVQIINHILSVDPLCDPALEEEKDCFQGELIISATEEKIVMVEAKLPEFSEKEIFTLFASSHQEIRYLIGFFRYIANSLGVKKPGHQLEIKEEKSEQWQKKIAGYLKNIFQNTGLSWSEKERKWEQVKQRLIESSPQMTEEDAVNLVEKTGNDIHGSALFTRGDTEVLSIITLGKVSEKQVVDNMFFRSHKHFIHHYNFSNFAVNELSGQRGVSRREIGHGTLVEKTFAYLIPSLEAFPYTIRVVSEVLAADGSSSQASVCATSLALMTAGVPLIRPAAGISLGLLDGQIYTDINSLEDKLGEMDFKIAGTEKGVCSLQLDVKNQGISLELLKECLEKGRLARVYLLQEMKKHIFSSRQTLPHQVIKCRRFYVAKEKIGWIIGPSGKTINQLTAQTGATIEIQPDHYVYIYHQDEKQLTKTFNLIQNIINQK